MGEIIIYQNNDGVSRIDVQLENDTLWLTQEQMATLFNKAKSTINEHIKNIFEENELDKNSTVRNFRTVQQEGNRQVERDINHYNLDLILAIGYRVKSPQGIQFRQWATEILKEYLAKGFAMDDDRLKENGGGHYWKELLERIRDIRSSEKVFYRQVLDLFATSQDYQPNAEEAIEFFKIVQNKLHFASHGHTAAELIYKRADAEKDFMGLTNFKGSLPTMQKLKLQRIT